MLAEDDEMYSARYVETMLAKLDGVEMAGQISARYYNVADRRWMQANNTMHASLCRTALCGKRAIERLRWAAQAALDADSPFVDQWLWGLKNPQPCPLRENLFRDDLLSIGIKGMPGRPGLGSSHRTNAFPNRDPEMVELKKWIGQDAEAYARFYKEGVKA